MAKPPAPNTADAPPPRTAAEIRAAKAEIRLAAALRENLRRRKAQSRGREAEPPAKPEPTGQG
jgi:hypothetical protein